MGCKGKGARRPRLVVQCLGFHRAHARGSIEEQPEIIEAKSSSYMNRVLFFSVISGFQIPFFFADSRKALQDPSIPDHSIKRIKLIEFVKLVKLPTARNQLNQFNEFNLNSN